MKDENKSRRQLIAELVVLRKKQGQENQESLIVEILNDLPVGVAVMKGDNFQYTHVNSFIAAFNGESPERHIGKTVRDMVNPQAADNIIDNLKKVKQLNQGSEQRELQVPLPSGEMRTLLDWHYPLKDHDSVLAVIADITEQKKLEKQLRQVQKTEAIGRLAGGLAHEFNNLLSPILGYTELLLGDKCKTDSDRHALEQIQIAGKRAKGLVRQMQAYGRQSIARREDIDLKSLLLSTIDLVVNSAPANISIDTDFDNNLPFIHGMSEEIRQVFLNLFINASLAMPNGGKIAVSLVAVDSYQFFDLEGSPRAGNFIRVRVQDTGVGMDQTTMDKIFEPFFTTRAVGDGSGLGLSVVQGIVEQHKGRIEVTSILGKGTTFHLYFPVATEVSSSEPTKCRQPLCGKKRILLTDDDPMVITLTKIMLEKFGYTVLEFLDCQLALDWFSKHPTEIDLVITDYDMPKMNGKQFARAINEIRSDLAIVLLTGYGDLIAKDDIHLWGIDDTLIKPFNLKELGEVVSRGMGRINPVFSTTEV